MLPSLIARQSIESGGRLYDDHDIKLFILVGWGLSFSFVALADDFHLLLIFSDIVHHTDHQARGF